MKKQIFKILAASFLAAILALNLTSTLTFEIGGEDAEARNSMTCWSQTKFNMTYNTVWCPGCQAQTNYRGESGEGTCSQDPVVEG